MTLVHGLEAITAFLTFCLYHSNAARRDWLRKLQAEIAAHHKTSQALENMHPAIDAANHMASIHAGDSALQRRRADEFFNIIQGIEVERDTWKKFYDRASHHAGVAQAWLLRDLHEAVQRANAYAQALRALGKKASDIKVSPELKEIVEEFGLQQEKSAEIKQAPGFEAASQVEKELADASRPSGSAPA